MSEVYCPGRKGSFLFARFSFVGARFLEYKRVGPSLNNESYKWVTFLLQLSDLKLQVDRTCVFSNL